MKRSCLSAMQCLLAAAALGGDALPDAKTVVFLGDSITHSGQYIAFLETALLAETDRRFSILNLGLSSETVSGLSEEGHAGGKFPRPDLHERLDRVLKITRPDLVIACYGMNCGIYEPLDPGRFQKFKDGISWMREKCRAAGANVIHLTPPTHDSLKRAGVAPGYNAVLATYGGWLLEQRKNGWDVIDIHGPMDAAWPKKRKKDPDAFISKDGVHPGAEGHWLMAQLILRHWRVDCDYTTEDFSPGGRLGELHALVSKRQRVLAASYLSEAGHKRPGVAPGLPLEQAIRQAAELDAPIERAVSARRKIAAPSSIYCPLHTRHHRCWRFALGAPERRRPAHRPRQS